MKKQIFITDHAKVRLAERTTLKPIDWEYYTKKAFTEGLETSAFEDPLRSYLKELCHNQGQFVAKVYNRIVYIFNNNHGSRLITVYPIDEQYSDTEKYRIRIDDLQSFCKIQLTNKRTGDIFYWSVMNNLTTNLDEIKEFKNQISANNFINNNFALDYYLDDYKVEIV